jgi:hypothetical protein
MYNNEKYHSGSAKIFEGLAASRRDAPEAIGGI